MESISEVVTARIAATIADRDRSRNSVAQAAGIPFTTFSRKLAGRGDFTIREVGEIATALEVPFSYLVMLNTIEGES